MKGSRIEMEEVRCTENGGSFNLHAAGRGEMSQRVAKNDDLSELSPG